MIEANFYMLTGYFNFLFCELTYIWSTFLYLGNWNLINLRRLELLVLIELQLLLDIGNKQLKNCDPWEKGSMRWALCQKLICRYQYIYTFWIPICCSHMLIQSSGPQVISCSTETFILILLNLCLSIFVIWFSVSFYRRPPLLIKL